MSSRIPPRPADSTGATPLPADPGSAGCLWIVATPIGNLGDFPPRAVATLQRVELILCEDTRTSAPLLRHFGIETRLRALHEHNERASLDGLLARLQGGAELALISDAGTPLLSDPGYPLVRAARDRQLPVRCVPGPCALVAALSIAGLPTDRFAFEGFLPAQRGARAARLQALAADERSLLFYEAPHRLLEFLEAAIEAFGAEREAAIARELTKRFESLYRDSLGALLDLARQDPNLARGELVIAIAGATPQETGLAEARRIHRLLAAELPPTQAAKLAAKITGRKRGEFYGERE